MKNVMLKQQFLRQQKVVSPPQPEGLLLSDEEGLGQEALLENGEPPTTEGSGSPMGCEKIPASPDKENINTINEDHRTKSICQKGDNIDDFVTGLVAPPSTPSLPAPGNDATTCRNKVEESRNCGSATSESRNCGSSTSEKEINKSNASLECNATVNGAISYNKEQNSSAIKDQDSEAITSPASSPVNSTKSETGSSANEESSSNSRNSAKKASSVNGKKCNAKSRALAPPKIAVPVLRPPAYGKASAGNTNKKVSLLAKPPTKPAANSLPGKVNIRSKSVSSAEDKLRDSKLATNPSVVKPCPTIRRTATMSSKPVTGMSSKPVTGMSSKPVTGMTTSFSRPNTRQSMASSAPVQDLKKNKATSSRLSMMPQPNSLKNSKLSSPSLSSTRTIGKPSENHRQTRTLTKLNAKPPSSNGSSNKENQAPNGSSKMNETKNGTPAVLPKPLVGSKLQLPTRLRAPGVGGIPRPKQSALPLPSKLRLPSAVEK